MTKVQLSLTLPDGLASEAEKAGLLQPGAIERLLREEIRRRSIAELKTATDRMAAVDEPVMSAEEVQSEIDGARAQRRAGRR